MNETLKYLKYLQSKYPNMQLGQPKDVLNYRKSRLNLCDDDSDRILKLFSNNNTIEFWENLYRKNIIEPFIKALPVEIGLKLEKIHFGLLPTYNVNASAIKSPNGDPIVIIHIQLFRILQQYNESQFIFAKLSSSNKNEDKLVASELFMDSCKEIIKCVKYYNFLPKLSMLPDVLTAEEFMNSILKTFIQELFIILHEFAHIYLGHNSTTKHTKLFCLDDNTSVEEFVRTQKMELEADLQATKWIMEVSKSKKLINNSMLVYLNMQPYLALEVFMLFHLIDINLGRYDQHICNKDEDEVEVVAMRIIDIVKELDNLISNSKINDRCTHPKASVRFINLVSKMIDKLNDKEKKFLLDMFVDMVYFETFKVEL